MLKFGWQKLSTKPRTPLPLVFETPLAADGRCDMLRWLAGLWGWRPVRNLSKEADILSRGCKPSLWV